MNERDIIECLRQHGDDKIPGLIFGIGDDCAVIEKDATRSMLVTMDTLVENVHFDLQWHPPGKLGEKAVAVNVSDIAAMGGKPVFLFLSLGLPESFDSSWVRNFSQGVSDACKKYDCWLAGGDTVRSCEGVQISITVIGEISTELVVYRHNAALGDSIWVTGKLGEAAAGLELFKSGLKYNASQYISLTEAHLKPEARVTLARMLAEKRIAHAMMDMSDGLATDLSHLCEQSRMGALIHSEKLPVSLALNDAASLLQKDSLELMLQGGEDYELVFTASTDKIKHIKTIADQTGVQVTEIGTIVEQKGVRLVMHDSVPGDQREVDISFKGFDHFPNK